jgi:hypothetical protein
MFENGVLGNIFGQKREDVPGECRRLHNEGFCDLYSCRTLRPYDCKSKELLHLQGM